MNDAKLEFRLRKYALNRFRKAFQSVNRPSEFAYASDFERDVRT